MTAVAGLLEDRLNPLGKIHFPGRCCGRNRRRPATLRVEGKTADTEEKDEFDTSLLHWSHELVNSIEVSFLATISFRSATGSGRNPRCAGYPWVMLDSRNPKRSAMTP